MTRHVRIRAPLAQTLEDIAKREDRSLQWMSETLLHEAIRARVRAEQPAPSLEAR